eukprot:5552598-Pleurochrysis_carterae.AAC.2
MLLLQGRQGTRSRVSISMKTRTQNNRNYVMIPLYSYSINSRSFLRRHGIKQRFMLVERLDVDRSDRPGILLYLSDWPSHGRRGNINIDLLT